MLVWCLGECLCLCVVFVGFVLVWCLCECMCVCVWCLWEDLCWCGVCVNVCVWCLLEDLCWCCQKEYQQVRRRGLACTYTTTHARMYMYKCSTYMIL